MRSWRTQIHTIGGDDGHKAHSTCYKTYSLREAKEIMDEQRNVEMDAGLPKRALQPMSRYILEELIMVYFKKYAPKGAILEEISIEDTKYYGV